MFENIIEIKLSDIDVNDTAYQISLDHSDINALAASIKTTGLINPPIVRPVGLRYTIVSGFQRVKACSLAGMEKIRARIISQKNEHPDLICAVLAISDNSFQRPLRLYELLRAVALLNQLWDADIISDKFQAVFNQEVGKKYVQDLLKIAHIQAFYDLIRDEKISMKTALRMTDFNKKDSDIFVEVFSRIKTSSNKQLDIITYSKEIAARESGDIFNLFQSKEIKEILEHENPDQGFKGNLLRSYLYQRRYPTVSNVRTQFADAVKKLKLNTGMKIEAPRDFEGTAFNAQFTFKNVKEFQQKVEKLTKISNTKELKGLIK